MTQSPFFIRDVYPEDFDSIFELLVQLWNYKLLDKEKMRMMFVQNLAAPHIIYICSEEEGQITGFCSLTIKNNLWQQGLLGNIDELVVSITHQNRGTGSRLLSKITEIAKEKGCVQLELDSAFHREKAHQFYLNQGFVSRAYLFSKSLI